MENIDFDQRGKTSLICLKDEKLDRAHCVHVILFESAMIVRLGQIIYWIASALAALIGGFGAITEFARDNSQPSLGLLVYLSIALVIWLIGRAALHFLPSK